MRRKHHLRLGGHAGRSDTHEWNRPLPAVVAGVTMLNGSATFTPMKDLSCGVVHFKLTISFAAQGSNGASCTGNDAIAFSDLQPDGGSGTDTLGITCSDGTTCTETYDVTFTPQ